MGISCDTVLQEVVSGDSIAGRPEMIKLLQMVESGAYEAVVCIDMDRLSRGSGADQALVINTFKYSDTKIITPAKTYDFALETDEQFAELSLFMAKQEYRQIKKRLYQGRISSAKEGKWQGTESPYGYESYRIKGKKGQFLRIVPEEASVIKMIFDLYLNDPNMGSGKLAEKLNALGYRQRNGSSWLGQTILNILKNPVYKGTVVFSRRKNVTIMENGELIGKRVFNNDPLVVPGLHDAIISESDFDRAREIRLNKMSDKTHKDKTLINPLSVVLHCEYCGKPMRIVSKPTKDSRIRVACRTTGCPCHMAYVDLIEEKILQALKILLSDYSFGAAETRSAALIEETLSSLSSKLKTLETKLGRAMEAYEIGAYDVLEYQKRSSETKSEIAEIKAQIAEITKKKENASDLAPKIQNVLDTYYSLPDPTSKNKMLREILERVDFRKDSIGPENYSDFELTLHPRIQ